MTQGNGRACQRWNQQTPHQRMAGVASWVAFSARWRARQGLPLLHPMDVQYVTPQDFCNQWGMPLAPEKQRRLFREYVHAAVEVLAVGAVVARGRPGVVSGDLAFVRVCGFVRGVVPQVEVWEGRQDVPRWDEEAISPTHPYGVPPAASCAGRYWIEDGTGLGEGEEAVDVRNMWEYASW